MKNFTKAIALCMALLMILTCPIGASAAEVADATIDFEQKGSLTIYKIDLTNAEKDGIWDSSYLLRWKYRCGVVRQRKMSHLSDPTGRRCHQEFCSQSDDPEPGTGAVCGSK